MTFQDIKKLLRSSLTVNLSLDSTVPLREYIAKGIALRENTLSYEGIVY